MFFRASSNSLLGSGTTRFEMPNASHGDPRCIASPSRVATYHRVAAVGASLHSACDGSALRGDPLRTASMRRVATFSLRSLQRRVADRCAARDFSASRDSIRRPLPDFASGPDSAV